MKVLYISYDGMCDPVGASQVLTYIAELSKQNIEFFLISFEKTGKFESGKANVEALIKELPIQWIPLRYTKNPPVISTMLDLRKMKKLCRRICNENDIAFIHARSYISALAALKIKRTRNIPYLFDMRGFWADERVDGGIWRLKNPVYRTVYRFFKKKEKALLKNAAAVISLTHAAKEFMTSDWKVPAEKVHVIPCAADYSHFGKRNENDLTAFRKKYSVPQVTAKTLLYVGSVGTWYMLSEMADFYLIFRKHFPGSQWILCVNETNPAVDTIKKRFPDDVHVVKNLSRAEMPLMLSLADYSIMFIKPAFSKKASSPIKLGESLAVGIPVICNGGVGDLDAVEKEGYGVVINDFSDGAYSQACEILRCSVFDSELLRNQSKKEYDLGENTLKYLGLYSSMNKLGKTDIYQE